MITLCYSNGIGVIKIGDTFAAHEVVDFGPDTFTYKNRARTSITVPVSDFVGMLDEFTFHSGPISVDELNDWAVVNKFHPVPEYQHLFKTVQPFDKGLPFINVGTESRPRYLNIEPSDYVAYEVNGKLVAARVKRIAHGSVYLVVRQKEYVVDLTSTRIRAKLKDNTSINKSNWL